MGGKRTLARGRFPTVCRKAKRLPVLSSAGSEPAMGGRNAHLLPARPTIGTIQTPAWRSIERPQAAAAGDHDPDGRRE